MPSITFAQAQVVLGRRVGPWIALADLHEAMFTTLVYLGFNPADPVLVSDADLLGVAIDQLPAFFDVAQWRALESICSNLTEAGLRSIGVLEDYDRARVHLRDRTDKLQARVEKQYGVGLPTLQVGVVSSNFQQQDPSGTIDF